MKYVSKLFRSYGSSDETNCSSYTFAEPRTVEIDAFTFSEKNKKVHFSYDENENHSKKKITQNKIVTTAKVIFLPIW